MKKYFISVVMLAAMIIAGCGKKEEPPVIETLTPVEEVQEEVVESSNDNVVEDIVIPDVQEEDEKPEEYPEETPVSLIYDRENKMFRDNAGNDYIIAAADTLDIYFESYVVAGDSGDYIVINPLFYDTEESLNYSAIEEYTAYSLDLYTSVYGYDKAEVVSALKQGEFYSKFGHIISNSEDSAKKPVVALMPNMSPIMDAAKEVFVEYYPYSTIDSFRILIDEIEDNVENIKITCYASSNSGNEAIGILLDDISISEENGETVFKYGSGRVESVNNFYVYTDGKADSDTVKILKFD